MQKRQSTLASRSSPGQPNDQVCSAPVADGISKASLKPIDNDGDVYSLMNVLHEQVGIEGLFSDWPATTTFYANCMGLK